MKEVSEAARRKEATLSFVFVFPYKNGIFIVKQVKTLDDSILLNMYFVIVMKHVQIIFALTSPLLMLMI